MGLEHNDFVNFVRKNAIQSLKRSLLQTNAKRYSPTFKNIFLTYYSMPDWLDTYYSVDETSSEEFVSLASTMRFDWFLHFYRNAARDYQEHISNLLELILKSGSGKALLQEIAVNPAHTLRIMPYSHWYHAKYPGEDNAIARPVHRSEKLANVNEGTLPDSEDGYARGDPILNSDSVYHETLGTGTGKGANVAIFFSPEIFGGKQFKDRPGFEPDEVLFHEMVHTTRIFRGVMSSALVNQGYGNEEEYLATVIANLYLSEKNKSLRGAYGSLPQKQHEVLKISPGCAELMRVIDPLPKNWAVMKDPDNFYTNIDVIGMPPSLLIGHFSAKQKDFYLALAKLPDGNPQFNPIKQHLKENLKIDN